MTGSAGRRRVGIFLSLSLVAAGLASCGGAAPRATDAPVHLNGKEIGDYVTEVSATGAHFLVPVSTLAGQGSTTFDIGAPTTANMTLGPGPAGPGPWGTEPTLTAVVPRSARVEILATRAAGVQFHLGWEDTCGGSRMGQHGVAGGTGGQGRLVLTSPAVVMLKLPKARGLNQCYVAATAWARPRSSLRLTIVDY
jgi:hypothetical protein